MTEAAPPQTFLFADLAGFTALTEVHGDEQAADLVDFARQARALLSAYDAAEVKTMGDALMLRASDAAQGVRLACRLATEIGGQHGFPGIREVAAESSLPQCDFRDAGVKRFKNVREPVAVFAALDGAFPDARPTRFVVDPVCRMSVDPKRADERRQHRGAEYRFCSEACAKAFDADPGHYHRQRYRRLTRAGRRWWLPRWLTRPRG